MVLGWALNPLSDVLVRKPFEDAQTNTEGRQPCEDRGRVGIMVPQAKELLRVAGSPDVRRGKDGFFSRAFRGSMALLTP